MANEKSEQENDFKSNQDMTVSAINNESKSLYQNLNTGLNLTSPNALWTDNSNKKTSQDSVHLYGSIDTALNCKFNCTPTVFPNDIDSGCVRGTFKHSVVPSCTKNHETSFVRITELDCLTDLDIKPQKELELQSSQIVINPVEICKSNNFYDSQLEYTYMPGEKMVFLDDACSSEIICDQKENETYQEYENSDKEENCDQGGYTRENLNNSCFTSTVDSNVNIKQDPSCNKKTEVRFKINAAPQSTVKVEEVKDERAGFLHSLKNVVHSCIGKKASTTPIINNEDIIVPAHQQLEPSKMKSLIKLLESTPEGADMKLSLFMSACAHDPRNLQPFPDSVLNDNDINRHLLYYIAEEVPSVNMILFLLKEKEPLVTLRKELLPVVDWLIRIEDPRLEIVKDQEKHDLLTKLSIPVDILPSKIFRLKTKRSNENEKFWQEVKGDTESIFAYHSCRVDQAHSLLYYGLHNNYNNKGVFGQGVYLTDNLSLCLNNCKPGHTWGKSSVATKVKLIFVTELIANHSVLSYDGRGVPFLTDTFYTENLKNSRYYFIKKPKLVRLRYLLTYVMEPSVLPINPFSYVPIRKKLIKYLSIFRISLLIATILMGATSSQRKAQANTWLLDTLHNCYQKFSTDFMHWPIWQYVEPPYVAVSSEIPDRIPQASPNYL